MADEGAGGIASLQSGTLVRQLERGCLGDPEPSSGLGFTLGKRSCSYGEKRFEHARKTRCCQPSDILTLSFRSIELPATWPTQSCQVLHFRWVDTLAVCNSCSGLFTHELQYTCSEALPGTPTQACPFIALWVPCQRLLLGQQPIAKFQVRNGSVRHHVLCRAPLCLLCRRATSCAMHAQAVTALAFLVLAQLSGTVLGQGYCSDCASGTASVAGSYDVRRHIAH